ncbi:MAG TPA: hypothetical protein PKH07_11185 [bacterium]|nr:hypothetical protein [bacterium]
MIKSEHLRTFPVGMLCFVSIYGRQANLLIAGSVMRQICGSGRSEMNPMQ